MIVRAGSRLCRSHPEGERVLASAQRMLHSERAILQQELGSQTDLPQGVVRIAAVPTAMPIVARFAALLQARRAGIRPAVLSMSSDELEQGLADLSLDLALGYTERMGLRDTRLVAWPQFTPERYFCCAEPIKPTHRVCSGGRPYPPGRRLGACRCAC